MSKQKSHATQHKFHPSHQVGDKVRLLGWKHLYANKRKPREFGHIVRIDGGYIYVLPCGWKRTDIPFECYDPEIEVVRRYASRKFNVGDLVSLANCKSLDWGKAKPRPYGVVAGIKGPYIIVKPKDLPQRTFEVRAGELSLVQ